MAATSEKIPIALAGPEDLQQFMPPVSNPNLRYFSAQRTYAICFRAKLMLIPIPYLTEQKV